jgi:hypothetical protein
MATDVIPDTELTDELIARVMKLSKENRKHLLLLLIESAGDEKEPEEVSRLWKEELLRRVEKVQSGNYVAYSIEEVNRKLQEALREARKQ